MIELDSVGYRDILDGASARLSPDAITGIVGPNGAGKTTLLRCITGALTPTSGEVRIDATAVPRLRPRALARQIAVVSQEQPGQLELSVAELVALGRLPYRESTSETEKVVAGALEQVGMSGLARRKLSELSGGERQRAMIARALAQRPRHLLLDEPGNHLDIHHQLDLFQLVRDYPGGVVIVLHDLNQALAYCDEVLVLGGGRLVAFGPPEDVLTPEVLEPLYRVRVERAQNHLTFTRKDSPT